MNLKELKSTIIRNVFEVEDMPPELVEQMTQGYTLICEYLYTPTFLGASLDEQCSARKFNNLLQELGFQYRDNNEWKLTSQGLEYGAYTPSQYKMKESEDEKTYSIKYLIRWKREVVEVINEYIKNSERKEAA